MSIRVGIVGVGNCAKSLVEGVAHYTRNPDDTVGLMHPDIGGYRPADIEFVAAFDVDIRKVHQKLHDAINAEPNRTLKIADPLEYDVVVQRGPTVDSIIDEMRAYFIHESNDSPVDVAEVLRRSGTQILLNYLPTGSDEATYTYARAALDAGCSFINCMPTPIAKDDDWRGRFACEDLVLMGDDIKSQCGATIVNRVLLSLLRMRGIRVVRSDQVNFGGNADHYNLHYRPEAKEASKEAALSSVLGPDDAKPEASMVYTEANFDHKEARIRIEGEMFGHIPVSLDVTLDDEDSPNSGGVVIDAVRGAKVLLDRCRASDARYLCAFLMKSPFHQLEDVAAGELFRKVLGVHLKDFLDEHSW